MGNRVTNIASGNAVVGTQIGDVNPDNGDRDDVDGAVTNIAAGNARVGIQIGTVARRPQ
ncbi:hypothetical protein [Nonomuraea typhae]|uniref:Uncharacterized protein n=1 Tax=Nonomuraea typhae TaxID=2603600 RepID=A0ABW7YMN9_9ACTN